MRSAFRAINGDNDCFLSKEELVQAAKHFSLPIPEDHLHEIFDKVLDVDGNGAHARALRSTCAPPRTPSNGLSGLHRMWVA